jgi:hypothetical protein
VIRRVADAVARELARFGPATGIAPVVEVWPAAVGPEIARNAWPARLGRDGTLHVHARDSVWVFELTAKAEEIRRRLGEKAPVRLAFAPGPLPEPERETSADLRRPRAEPTPGQRAEAESLVRGIRDADLRKVVAKAVALSLAAAESDRFFW